MRLKNLNRYASRLRRYRSKLLGLSTGSLNKQQNLQGKFCRNPFVQMDVYEQGKVYSCCSSWLPTPLGNLNNSTILESWNSPTSQDIRRSIFDGSFRYCDHKVCPLIQSNELPSLEEARKDADLREIIDNQVTELEQLPTFINLCNDASCNLSCPSCRVEQIIYPKGAEFEKRLHLQDKITTELFAQPNDRHFTVNVTGSGDPIASTVFRTFLYNLDGKKFPNMKINLQTNGVLLTPKTWERMHKIHKNINTILISFDAATEATYNITRRGGNWSWLLKNTERLGELRKTDEVNFLRLDFVVQQANYKEMPAFVEIAKSLNADRVSFAMVLDWGTWSRKEYIKQCIWEPDHEEFNDFLKVLENPVFDDPKVFLGNLTEYRKLALSR